MYELKTKLNDSSVIEFINSISDQKRKSDSLALIKIISELTNEKPHMWGNSIIGYGKTTYTNSTNKEYSWFIFGFSPRKMSLSIYFTAYSDFIHSTADEMGLKHGKGCVYIKDLEKVNIDKLKNMISYTMIKNDQI